jgi:hypothetical protein
MLHPFQDLKAPSQDVVGSPTPDVGHKADAARVMLIFLPVQTMSAHVGSLQKRFSYLYQKMYFYAIEGV